jgi:hypothetical protein
MLTLSVRAAVAAFALCLAGVCLSAPAPSPKREKPLDLRGQWHHRWGTADYYTTFEGAIRGGPCVSVTDTWNRGHWAGTWTLDGRTLNVTEQAIDRDGVRGFSFSWRIELDGNLEGEVTLGRLPTKLTRLERTK